MRDDTQPAMQDYQRRRDKDPVITISWIAAAPHGRQVPLNAFNCPFCKTTVVDHIRGKMVGMINAPMNVHEFGFAMTARCKYCKQNFRFVYIESEPVQIEIAVSQLVPPVL